MRAMTKNIFLIYLICFLAACEIIPGNAVNNSPPLNLFDFSKQCPHLCWLGINPGVTTVYGAKLILKSSNLISQESMQVSSSNIFLAWFPSNDKNHPCMAGIDFNNGLVQSLFVTTGLSNPDLDLPFTINDFINRLGMPNEISFSDLNETDSYSTEYYVYFQSRKILLYVDPNLTDSWFGPDPIDRIQVVELNDAFDINSLQSGSIIQPWLGYGHIEDYKKSHR